jgi:hypothetical protein
MTTDPYAKRMKEAQKKTGKGNRCDAGACKKTAQALSQGRRRARPSRTGWFWSNARVATKEERAGRYLINTPAILPSIIYELESPLKRPC